jgi:hypothetical protein
MATARVAQRCDASGGLPLRQLQLSDRLMESSAGRSVPAYSGGFDGPPLWDRD